LVRFWQKMEKMSLSQTRLKFFDLIKSSSKIVLTTHFSPDDDAVSSILSLYYVLTNKFPKKQVEMIITGNPVNRFSVFLNYSQIHFVSELATKLASADLLICLDGGQYSRFSNDSQKILDSKIKTICLDHHQSPPDKFDLLWQNPKAASTAELVYQFTSKNFVLDETLSKLLLLGILGDTGNFNYIRPGQYHLFSLVKKILQISQINIQEFKSTYSLIEPQAFEIIQEFVKNSKFYQVKNWPDFQVSYLTNTYSDQLTSEASSIFVSNYLRLIKGYSWGFTVYQKSDGNFSLSFRSLPGSVNVRDLVERIGIGGGHDRASGAKVNAKDAVSSSVVINQIIDWLKTNQPLLT